MTPRSKDQSFSELLFRSVHHPRTWDLSGTGPLCATVHPGVLKAQVDPASARPYKNPVGEWTFKRLPPSASNFKRAWPFEIWKLLQTGGEGNFECAPYPHFSLSKTLRPQEDPQQDDLILSTWLDYALSPELWGQQGKWTRFHQELESLFRQHDLLMADSLPGYYALRPEAQKLSRYGFKGQLSETEVCLFLPWDFSLTALRQLESAVIQEF